MYDAVSGRFVSRDPIGFIDGSSLYSIYTSLGHTDPSGNASVTIPQAVTATGACGSLTASNKISIDVTVAGTGRLTPLFVVQFIRTAMTWNKCRKVTKNCCVTDPIETYYCEHYEILGQFTANRKGKPQILQSPSNVYNTNGLIGDEWISPGPIPSGNCGNMGSIVDTSVVKVISDPDGSLEEAWIIGRKIKICKESMTVLPGLAVEPPDWGNAVATSTGVCFFALGLLQWKKPCERTHEIKRRWSFIQWRSRFYL